MDPIRKIHDLARSDGRYAAEAFLFVFRALESAATERGHEGGKGHVTGRELLEAVRLLGKKEFGYLARTVFETWGVKTTRDFGEIVFLLVRENLMGKNEEDAIEDFEGVYDFEEVFETQFTLEIPKDKS